MVGLVMTERAGEARAGAEVRAYYCQRCDNPRPLGMLAPGRFWWRLHGRTVIAEGGTVRVWCERCSKEHQIDLRQNVTGERSST